MSWRGKKPALTQEQYAEFMRIRAARKALPGDKELAHRWGVNLKTLRNMRMRAVKRYGQP